MKNTLVILALASACVTAQEKTPASERKWEYCIVESLGTIGVSSGKWQGYVRICYAADDGCRVDNVTITEAVDKSNGFQEAELGQRAVAKALAQLGKDGWELVAVGEIGTVTNCTIPWRLDRGWGTGFRGTGDRKP